MSDPVYAHDDDSCTFLGIVEGQRWGTMPVEKVDVYAVYEEGCLLLRFGSIDWDYTTFFAPYELHENYPESYRKLLADAVALIPDDKPLVPWYLREEEEVRNRGDVFTSTTMKKDSSGEG